MRQCRLSQNNSQVVAWIAGRGAIKNAQVEITALGGFWKVEDISDFSMGDKEFCKHQRQNRNSLKSILPA